MSRYGDEEEKIEVTLNEQSIVMLGHRHTGLDVKKAAVAQGAPIGLDSVLKVFRSDLGHPVTVEDSEQVDVEQGAEFLAASPKPE